MSGTVLKKYTTIIDLDTFNSVLTDDIIEQLYVMNNKCFPKLPEKSKEHYYLRLINFIHNDIKYYRSSSRSPKSSPSASSSSDSKVIIQENLYGKLFTTFNVCDEYCKTHRYELYVMYADSSLTTVVSSCLVHYNDITGLARTKEICVGVPNKKYCKEMLLQVIEEIKKTQHIIKISIYCDKNNPAACKCYNSVFNSKETASNTKITETDDKYTFLYTLPRVRAIDDNSQLQLKKSKLKKSK